MDEKERKFRKKKWNTIKHLDVVLLPDNIVGIGHKRRKTKGILPGAGIIPLSNWYIYIYIYRRDNPYIWIWIINVGIYDQNEISNLKIIF